MCCINTGNDIIAGWFTAIQSNGWRICLYTMLVVARESYLITFIPAFYSTIWLTEPIWITRQETGSLFVRSIRTYPLHTRVQKPRKPYFENYDYTREQLMLFLESGNPLSPATFYMVFTTLWKLIFIITTQKVSLYLTAILRVVHICCKDQKLNAV